MDGSSVPNGVYRITVWTADASDNRAQRQFLVTLDTVAPAVGSSVSPSAITPNGDGRSDVTTLRWSAGERITGTHRILDRAGATVRAWSLVPGASGSLTWDGRDAAGRMVPDGRYRYRVAGSDPAGNVTTRDVSLNVDRTIASVLWSDGSFDPRAGQRSQLSFRLLRPATVTVAIYQGSTLVRTDLDVTSAGCRHVPLDLGWEERERCHGQGRHVYRERHRRQLDRGHEADPTCDGRGP